MIAAAAVGLPSRPAAPAVRRLLAVLACVLACLPVPAARADVPVPALERRVTDLTGTLSADQRSALEGKLAEFEARKGAQIAVLMVATTRPDTIEQYGRRVLDAWKLGRKGIDDGALLLVAKDDRRIRIETQYGLEGVLPDATARRIIDETITPHFRSGDFAGGLAAGVERMIAVVDGEPLPPPARTPADDRTSGLESLFLVGFVLVVFVSTILRGLFGRVGGAAAAGGIGGVLAWFIVGSLGVAIVVAVLVLALSLVTGVAPGAGRALGRGRRGGWGAGPWGGGGWSGGRGGGWSGGGGSGGGGGASGSW